MSTDDWIHPSVTISGKRLNVFQVISLSLAVNEALAVAGQKLGGSFGEDQEGIETNEEYIEALRKLLWWLRSIPPAKPEETAA
jgi:hypothetical protein